MQIIFIIIDYLKIIFSSLLELRKYFKKYVELKENGHKCNEEILDKHKIRKYLHGLCHNKANVRASFEEFCTKHKRGKYKCSKSWKCKSIGCMGCIKHECIANGSAREIRGKDVDKMKGIISLEMEILSSNQIFIKYC